MPFGISTKKLLIGAVILIAVIRFRNEIAGALARVPGVNKLAGVG